jgi:hypothetical protein
LDNLKKINDESHAAKGQQTKDASAFAVSALSKQD